MSDHAADPPVVPTPEDLPGSGWLVIGGELTEGPASGEAELIDCVGPDFPVGDEIEASASSAHFVRHQRQLVHGIGVVFTSDEAGARAAAILRGPDFARCLGRAVAADLGAAPASTELLDVQVHEHGHGNRVTFTGANQAGVLPVHLEVAVVSEGPVVTLLWFGDTPHPFPDDDRAHVLDRIAARVGRANP